MAINLPEKRLSAAPAPKRRQIPTELILQVMGRNPLAEGISSGTKTLAETLAKKFEKERLMKQNAEQIAAIAKSTGTDVTGISDPAIAAGIAKNAADRKSEESRAQDSLEMRREQAANYLDVRKAMAEMMAQNAQAGRDLKRDQFKDKQVNAYSSNLEKTGIPNAVAVGERVLNLLPERGQDVPGFGPLAGMAPSWALSQGGKDMRQSAAQLFNIELRNRSGAAVTDPELMRLKEEFGQGKYATEESLRTGIAQYVTRLKEVARNIDAGVDPSVREEYMTRGGRDVGASFDSMVNNPRILPLPKGGGKTNAMRSKYGY